MGCRMTDTHPTPDERRPRRRKEARPAELLEAAWDVFAEKGFAAARMEDIAARAGVAKGTVYLYFAGKEAVFQALVQSAVLPNLERFETALTADPAPAADRLRRLMTGIIGVIDQNPRLLVFPKLVIGEGRNFPEIAAFYKANMIDRLVALIAGIHAQGVAQGEFRPMDSDTAARLCLSPLLMLMVWRTTFDVPGARFPAPGDFIAAHLDTFLRGLAADPQPGGPAAIPQPGGPAASPDPGGAP